MKFSALLGAAFTVLLLAGCVSPEEQARMDAEQRAADQNKCMSFGFQPETNAFAHCMMGIEQQRAADAAADRRAAAAEAAADQRARDADQAAKDAADRDAWDRRTGQGKYAGQSSGDASTSPVHDSMPDLSDMHCDRTVTSSGSPNDLTTSSTTKCHN